MTFLLRKTKHIWPTRHRVTRVFADIYIYMGVYTRSRQVHPATSSDFDETFKICRALDVDHFGVKKKLRVKKYGISVLPDYR